MYRLLLAFHVVGLGCGVLALVLESYAIDCDVTWMNFINSESDELMHNSNAYTGNVYDEELEAIKILNVFRRENLLQIFGTVSDPGLILRRDSVTEPLALVLLVFCLIGCGLLLFHFFKYSSLSFSPEKANNIKIVLSYGILTLALYISGVMIIFSSWIYDDIYYDVADHFAERTTATTLSEAEKSDIKEMLRYLIDCLYKGESLSSVMYKYTRKICFCQRSQIKCAAAILVLTFSLCYAILFFYKIRKTLKTNISLEKESSRKNDLQIDRKLSTHSYEFPMLGNKYGPVRENDSKNFDIRLVSTNTQTPLESKKQAGQQTSVIFQSKKLNNVGQQTSVIFEPKQLSNAEQQTTVISESKKFNTAGQQTSDPFESKKLNNAEQQTDPFESKKLSTQWQQTSVTELSIGGQQTSPRNFSTEGQQTSPRKLNSEGQQTSLGKLHSEGQQTSETKLNHEVQQTSMTRLNSEGQQTSFTVLFESKKLSTDESQQTVIRRPSSEGQETAIRRPRSEGQETIKFSDGGQETRKFSDGGQETRKFSVGGQETRKFSDGGQETRKFSDGGQETRKFSDGGQETRKFSVGGQKTPTDESKKLSTDEGKRTSGSISEKVLPKNQDIRLENSLQAQSARRPIKKKKIVVDQEQQTSNDSLETEIADASTHYTVLQGGQNIMDNTPPIYFGADPPINVPHATSVHTHLPNNAAVIIVTHKKPRSNPDENNK